jgi:uncharacterized protein
MYIAGYIASALIGLSLGLIGGGGSILTVPVLVYLFGLSPLLATSYSLFVIGSTSLVGAVNNWRKGFVSLKTVEIFGVSSIFTVFITRKIVLPLIPIHLFKMGQIEVTESMLTMIFFALLMVFAAISIIRNGQKDIIDRVKEKKLHVTKLLSYGVMIGLVTGLLGAGGGFLLIPVLVLLVGLPMREAIGTSLLIISLNSLIGFTGDLGHFHIDWGFLSAVTLIAIAGIVAGSLLSQKIPGYRLKKGFGWFVLAMGLYILVREIFFHQSSQA